MNDPVIYLITNTISGRQYVGKSKYGAAFRWQKHQEEAKVVNGRSYNMAIHRAIRKYGLSVFIVEVIATGTTEQLSALESAWIIALQSQAPQGYNMTRGGDGFTGRHTEEYKLKRSAAMKGKHPHTWTTESRAKLAARR